MAWRIEPNPVNPEAAIQWFKQRLALPDPEWRALQDEARRQAFFVSGLAALDLVQEVQEALERALSEGEPFEDFRKRLSERVLNAWGEGSKHRLEIIFRTNLQLAYGAGRYKEAVSVKELRPYWGLEVVLDGRTSGICRPLAGVVLPADHPFWKNHIPPLHFNCRTALVTYTRREGERLVREAPDHAPAAGFGAPPHEREWSPNPKDYDPQLWGIFLQSLGRHTPFADAYLAAVARREVKPKATDWMLALGRVAIADFPKRIEKVGDDDVRAVLGPKASRLEQKFTKHVVIEQQFRPDLFPEEYLAILRRAALHPEAVVVVHAPPRGPVILVAAPSAEVAPGDLGPNAEPWIVVVYELKYGTLVSGYMASSKEEVFLWNPVWLQTHPGF